MFELEYTTWCDHKILPGLFTNASALEAKCYDLANSVGVRGLSRLISRLRHRQFGVVVTTSYINSQAYRELKEDGHPVVVIAAKDIVSILSLSGLNRVEDVRHWLEANFPK